MAAGWFDRISGKWKRALFSTDGTMTANSDNNIPTEKAVVTYVTAAKLGLQPLQAVHAASTGNYPGVLVGNVLTITATGAFTADDITGVAGRRYLLKDQTTGAQKGVFDLTIAGGIGVQAVLTRSADFNTATALNAGNPIPVLLGTANNTTEWIQVNTITTINTDSLSFTEYTKNPADYLLKANNLSDLPNATVIVQIASAGGTADALTATFTVPLTLVDKMRCMVVPASANVTTTPTFAPDGLTARTIVQGGGQALRAGDIQALGPILLEYNLANTRWELINPNKVSLTADVIGLLPVTNTALNYTIVGSGGFSLGTGTAAQPAFASTGDVFTPVGSTTYRVNGVIYITKSGTACTISFQLVLGGGCTLTSVQLLFAGNLVSATSGGVMIGAGATLISTSNSVNNSFIVSGLIRVANAGTITPSIKFSASPTSPVMNESSFLEFTPYSSDSTNTQGSFA